MSWLAMDWAEETPVASVYERVILMALACRANSDGTDAYPSRLRMARSAMCDVRTVQRHLNNLLARGVIAHGDQAAARHIPADKRPVVYDLQIPYSWYSEQQLRKVNRDRHERGCPPLQPNDRPDLSPPPDKATRSDKGKPRPRKRTSDDGPSGDPAGGLTVTPPTPVDNSARGDSESGTGGLSDRDGVTLSPARPDSETHEPLRDQPDPDSDRRSQSPYVANADARDVPDRRTGGDGSSSEDERADERVKLAAGLLRTLLDELGPRFTEPSDQTKRQLLRAVARAWSAGATSAQLRELLSTNLTGIRDIGKVWVTRLTKLADELEDQPSPLPPVCGSCDARPGEGTHARIVWVDPECTTSRPCPNCHPAGRAGASERPAAGRTA